MTSTELRAQHGVGVLQGLASWARWATVWHVRSSLISGRDPGGGLVASLGQRSWDLYQRWPWASGARRFRWVLGVAVCDGRYLSVGPFTVSVTHREGCSEGSEVVGAFAVMGSDVG